MLEQLIEQLKEYCDCIGDFDERDVIDLINVISMATGWTSEPCDTFLMSSRLEVIDLPACLDCPFEFEPYYTPFIPDSFDFVFTTIDGLTETHVPVTEFAYIETDGKFRLNLPLPKCNCVGKSMCSCGCDVKYKLSVKYDAGYEDIPDCLFPVFCNLLEVVHAKNNCDCGDCADCDGKKYGSNNEPNIKYAEGDVVTVQLETDIGKMLVESYKNQLAMIGLDNYKQPYWGVVV